MNQPILDIDAELLKAAANHPSGKAATTEAVLRALTTTEAVATTLAATGAVASRALATTETAARALARLADALEVLIAASVNDTRVTDEERTGSRRDAWDQGYRAGVLSIEDRIAVPNPFPRVAH